MRIWYSLNDAIVAQKSKVVILFIVLKHELIFFIKNSKPIFIYLLILTLNKDHSPVNNILETAQQIFLISIFSS